MSRPSVLFFVEDPGAANFALGLPDALAALGLSATVAATGDAAAHLDDRGVASTPADGTGPAAARALIEARRPDLVLVGTSENRASLAFDLVAAARAEGLPTAGLVDARANAYHRFRGDGADPLRHCPDRLIVPDGETARAFMALGVSEGAIHIVGNPQHDRAAETARRLAAEDLTAVRRRAFGYALAGRAPILLFAGELSTGLDPAEFRRSGAYSLSGRGASDLRTEVVLEEVLYARAGLSGRPRLVVRLHPKESRTDYASYADEIDGWSAGVDPHEALFAADAVVGMSSTILMEAAAMGCSVVSIVPRESERAWVPSGGDLDWPVLWRREGIAEALAGALARGRTAPRSGPRASRALAETLAALCGRETSVAQR